MNTNKTYKGVFWIPSEPENHKNGLLKFLNETAYVDLFDSFDNDPLNIKSTRRTEICCIYGFLDNGRCCILHKCQLSISGGFGGLIGTLINFEYVFYSSNRDLIEKKTEFSKIEFKLNTLFHWGGSNSIESFHNEDDSYGLNYKKPSSTDFIFSNEKYELKLNHTTSMPLTTNKKSLLIEQDTSLILKLKSNENILNDFDFIEKIHDLFILFHADKVEINNTYQLTTSENEEYFFCYSNRKRFRKSKGYQNHEFGNLFTYYELIELTNINDLFNKWLSLYNQLNYPIELITICLSDISMNSQHKFMNLMYSLDVLQQSDKITLKLKKEKTLSKKETQIIERLKTEYKVDKNTLESLKVKLIKTENPSLKDKITTLLSQFSPFFVELFGITLRDFIEITVNTRNFYAHINETKPIIDNKDLYLYNLRLEAILVFIFYLKLGLPLDKIKLKIRMHDRFQRIIK